jgi:hypothetical protein
MNILTAPTGLPFRGLDNKLLFSAVGLSAAGRRPTELIGRN